MSAVAPAAFAWVIASWMAFVDPVANCSSRIMAMFRPGTIVQLTSGRSNLRRTIVTSKSATPVRPIVSVTGWPSGPRTWATIWSTVSPAVVCAVRRALIQSPRRSPAASAGVSGDHRADDRVAVVGRQLHPDPDERAGERLLGRLHLVGGHERGVSRIADRVGDAPDRGVGKRLVVEVLGVDVVVLDVAPRLVDQREVRVRPGDGRRRATRTPGSAARPTLPEQDARREHDDGEDGDEHRDDAAWDAATPGCSGRRVTVWCRGGRRGRLERGGRGEAPA